MSPVVTCHSHFTVWCRFASPSASCFCTSYRCVYAVDMQRIDLKTCSCCFFLHGISLMTGRALLDADACSDNDAGSLRTHFRAAPAALAQQAVMRHRAPMSLVRRAGNINHSVLSGSSEADSLERSLSLGGTYGFSPAPHRPEPQSPKPARAAGAAGPKRGGPQGREARPSEEA